MIIAFDLLFRRILAKEKFLAIFISSLAQTSQTSKIFVITALSFCLIPLKSLADSTDLEDSLDEGLLFKEASFGKNLSKTTSS